MSTNRALRQGIRLEPAYFWWTLIGVLFLLGTFNVAEIPSLHVVGFLSIAALLGVANMVLLYALGRMNLKMNRRFAALVGVVGLNYLMLSVPLVNHLDAEALKVLCGKVLVLDSFLLFCLMDWRGTPVRVLGGLFALYLLLNLALSVTFLRAYGLSVSGEFSGLFSNKNAFSAYLLYSFFFVILFFRGLKKGRGRAWIYNAPLLFAGALLLYLSRSRGAWAAALAGLATYFVWDWITRGKTRYRLYLWGVFGAAAGVILLVVLFFNELDVHAFNVFFRNYTGGNFASGRERLWGAVFERIKEHPWVGYGLGTRASDVTSMPLGSAHNVFLHTLLQAGVMGLLPLLLLLRYIWLFFWRGRTDAVVRLSASFFIATIAHQSFEVSLTQNNLAIGILIWSVIGCGISRVLQLQQENRERIKRRQQRVPAR